MHVHRPVFCSADASAQEKLSFFPKKNATNASIVASAAKRRAFPRASRPPLRSKEGQARETVALGRKGVPLDPGGVPELRRWLRRVRAVPPPEGEGAAITEPSPIPTDFPVYTVGLRRGVERGPLRALTWGLKQREPDEPQVSRAKDLAYGFCSSISG